jgi:hypothetical protein
MHARIESAASVATKRRATPNRELMNFGSRVKKRGDRLQTVTGACSSGPARSEVPRGAAS